MRYLGLLSFSILTGLYSSNSTAILFEQIQIKSVKNEPLSIEIPFKNSNTNQPLKVEIASDEEISALHLNIEPVQHLNILTHRTQNGSGHISLSTPYAIKANQLNFVVKVQEGTTQYFQHIKKSLPERKVLAQQLHAIEKPLVPQRIHNLDKISNPPNLMAQKNVHGKKLNISQTLPPPLVLSAAQRLPVLKVAPQKQPALMANRNVKPVIFIATQKPKKVISKTAPKTMLALQVAPYKPAKPNLPQQLATARLRK